MQMCSGILPNGLLRTSFHCTYENVAVHSLLLPVYRGYYTAEQRHEFYFQGRD